VYDPNGPAGGTGTPSAGDMHILGGATPQSQPSHVGPGPGVPYGHTPLTPFPGFVPPTGLPAYNNYSPGQYTQSSPYADRETNRQDHYEPGHPMPGMPGPGGQYAQSLGAQRPDLMNAYKDALFAYMQQRRFNGNNGPVAQPLGGPVPNGQFPINPQPQAQAAPPTNFLATLLGH
jgi:hypothetical protein